MSFSGVHRGRFFGVEASGRTITWAGAAFFATDGERITDLWVLGDIDAVKQQLGAARDSGFSSGAQQESK
jgi:predicted ester cyclase